MASTGADNSVTYNATAPRVTINQAAGQADPTNSSPINFTVIFDEPVSDFVTGDVTFSGTALGTLVGTVTGTGMTYNVAVSGMTSSGTVIANIATGVAHDIADNPNMAATSTDNTVAYGVVSISHVVVAEATPRNGILDSNDQLVITWAVDDVDSVGSKSLSVDGRPVSVIYGPYPGGAGTYLFAGVFGPIGAGNHSYGIQSADSKGNAAPACAGSFTVVVSNVTISSVVVVPAQGLMTWNAQDSGGVASSSLTVDGTPVSTIYGPYAAAVGLNYAGVFGTILAGTHSYTITATDNMGNSSRHTGTFDMPGLTISGVVVVPEQGLMTWNILAPNGVRTTGFRVDNISISMWRSTIYGPYAAASGDNYAGVYENGTPFSPGTYTYTITATDKLGNSSQFAGSFSVAALTIDVSTPPHGSPVPLTDQQLAPIVAEAERRWVVTNSAQVPATMSGITVQVADLPSGLLGEEIGKTILIDRDAAGYGWFIDPTPADDSEFANLVAPHTLAAQAGSPAANRVDLLTTVMHELGHVLGYNDDATGDLMNGTLSLGVRRTVAVDEVSTTLDGNR